MNYWTSSRDLGPHDVLHTDPPIQRLLGDAMPSYMQYDLLLPFLHLIDRPPHTPIINPYTENLSHWEAYPTEHHYDLYFPLCLTSSCERNSMLLARWRIGPYLLYKPRTDWAAGKSRDDFPWSLVYFYLQAYNPAGRPCKETYVHKRDTMQHNSMTENTVENDEPTQNKSCL